MVKNEWLWIIEICSILVYMHNLTNFALWGKYNWRKQKRKKFREKDQNKECCFLLPNFIRKTCLKIRVTFIAYLPPNTMIYIRTTPTTLYNHVKKKSIPICTRCEALKWKSYKTGFSSRQPRKEVWGSQDTITGSPKWCLCSCLSYCT